jgi:hypothetical protein
MRHLFKVLIFLVFVKLFILLIFFSQSDEMFEVSFALPKFDIDNLTATGKSFPEKKKLAVLVPFRDTFNELLQFAPHISKFLTDQKIPFHIFVINQVDDLRFNRGALLNVGFLYTENAFDYCVHHDVDLLPLNPKLSYDYPAEGVFHIADEFYHPTVQGIVS